MADGATESGGETLRRLRDRQRLSQAELAAAIGVTEGAIGQYERGITTPRRAKAVLLDRHLAASGELLAAFGYAAELSPLPNDDLVALQERVESLERALTWLAGQVVEMGAGDHQIEDLLRQIADRADAPREQPDAR